MRIIITILWCGISLITLACPTLAAMPYTFNGEKASHQYTRLIDTNQSQIVEPMSASLRNYPRLASVHFITGKSDLEFGNVEFSDETINNCAKNGYDTLVSLCTKAGQNPANICPYNGDYTDICCDTAYKYGKDECAYPRTLGTACGGKYRCYCDRSLYPQGADKKCTSPQEFDTSDSCVEDGKTYYAKCKCPSGYTELCTEKNLQGKGTACTENGETKYTGCQCKTGYNLTCSEYGPETPSDYCELNGIKYYKNCKDCSSFKYDETNCNLVLSGNTCGGKYESCKAPILYSDKTVSTAFLKDKTPIGIVFDVPNKLAVAFESIPNNNLGQTSCTPDLTHTNASYQIEVPALEKCDKTQVSSCGTNGKKNTAAILNQAAVFNETPKDKRECFPIEANRYPPQQLSSISFPGLIKTFSYVPAGCSEDWCGFGQWFLPSAGQLLKYINNKTAINQAAKLAGKTIANISGSNYFRFYSTTRGNKTDSIMKNHYWAVGTDKYIVEASMGDTAVCNNCIFLPVIDYGDNGSYIDDCRALDTVEEKCTDKQYHLAETAIGNGKTCYKCRDIKAGDFLFSDRTTSYQLEEGKTPIGLVADPDRKTAVALDYLKGLAWSKSSTDTPVPNGSGDSYADGQLYTQALIDDAALTGQSYPAASAAITYQPSVCNDTWCGRGHWYLGSFSEYAPLKIGGYYDENNQEKEARCPVPGKDNSFWYCSDVCYALYQYDGTNLYGTTDIWTSNEDSKEKAYHFMLGGMSSNYSYPKSVQQNVWPMISYGSGGTCGNDKTFDKDISLENEGYSCLSCKAGDQTKYICECSANGIEMALSRQGLKKGAALDVCPASGSCSPQMCDKKYYLQGCQGKDGKISTTYNTGDRVYCSTTQTCNLIDYRSDAQNKVEQTTDIGGNIGGDTIEGGTVTYVNACDTCALVGYYSKQPSGYLCQKETISGKECYKRCCAEGYNFNESTGKCFKCEEGYNFNESTGKCFKCEEGYVYDSSDGMCHTCSNSDYYYSLDHHMCLQIANNCPSNSIMCTKAVGGRGCYRASGYTKVSASNGACVGTYDAAGPSGEGCYTCLNDGDDFGTYDTNCHNCLVEKVFEP